MHHSVRWHNLTRAVCMVEEEGQRWWFTRSLSDNVGQEIPLQKTNNNKKKALTWRLTMFLRRFLQFLGEWCLASGYLFRWVWPWRCQSERRGSFVQDAQHSPERPSASRETHPGFLFTVWRLYLLVTSVAESSKVRFLSRTHTLAGMSLSLRLGFPQHILITSASRSFHGRRWEQHGSLKSCSLISCGIVP